MNRISLSLLKTCTNSALCYNVFFVVLETVFWACCACAIIGMPINWQLSWQRVSPLWIVKRSGTCIVCFCVISLHCTAVWARNIEWELLNGKTLLTLFAQNDQFIMTFFDCTMNVRYVGGTWWSPSNYWWWLLVISTPLPNCGGYAAEIHHFAEVMRRQKHILDRIGCTKMQFEQAHIIAHL